MIISTNTISPHIDFEKLLDCSLTDLSNRGKNDADYYLSRKGTKLEDDVFHTLIDNAVGTPFENSIEKISGQRFPDIIVKKYYGVEVKTTTQNHWLTTGNSVLESTRVENIDRIYLFFGKLSKPVAFRWKRYEECLREVVVTHSPRYLIDMDLPLNETIFAKMGISYDSLRNERNPIRPILDYYRSQLKEGEDLWWLDSSGGEEPEESQQTTSVNIRVWSNLSQTEKMKIKCQIMALFPQIFCNSTTKFNKAASWLVVRHGVVNPSFRDVFTAGGQQSLPTPFTGLGSLPKIFTHLYENFDQILSELYKFSREELKLYWEKEIITDDVETQWINLVSEHARDFLPTGVNIKRVLLFLHDRK